MLLMRFDSCEAIGQISYAASPRDDKTDSNNNVVLDMASLIDGDVFEGSLPCLKGRCLITRASYVFMPDIKLWQELDKTTFYCC